MLYGSKPQILHICRPFQQIASIGAKTVQSSVPFVHTHQLSGTLCCVVVERRSFVLWLYCFD